MIVLDLLQYPQFSEFLLHFYRVLLIELLFISIRAKWAIEKSYTFLSPVSCIKTLSNPIFQNLEHLYPPLAVEKSYTVYQDVVIQTLLNLMQPENFDRRK